MNRFRGVGATMRLRFGWSSACVSAMTVVMMLAAPPPATPQRPPVRTLDIAVEDAADPWSRADGSGYANDIVRAAFRAAGITVRLHVMPYARCKGMVIDAKITACFSMSPDLRPATGITLSDKPLFECMSAFVMSRNGRIKATRASELPRGTVVGAVLGYEYPAAVRDLERSGAITLQYAASEQTNLRKLVAGRIDLAIVNYNELKTLEYVSANAGVATKVQAAFVAGMLKSYIGFNDAHSQSAWARAQFNKGAAIIASSGELAAIRGSWSDHIRIATRTGTIAEKVEGDQ
ncbi:MAG: transporter substrate-binding domain-containing protein [bacterium]